MARRDPSPTKPAAGAPAAALSGEDAAAIAAMPFEQALGELESILEHIEEGGIGLEESLRQFHRGNALVKRCRSILDAAELQVRELAADEGDGDSGES